tara:strand:+ start:151 stop:522 length:372 start_codon:yes stop_codon:yes gene_type:complete
MKIKKNIPPRLFEVGNKVKFNIKDCGSIYLKSDEQVTFKCEKGSEYDVTKKEWGYYATPSLNGRLKNFGLKGVLIINNITRKFFVFLVESGKEKLFNKYCDQENLSVVCWLDSNESCENLLKK